MCKCHYVAHRQLQKCVLPWMTVIIVIELVAICVTNCFYILWWMIMKSVNSLVTHQEFDRRNRRCFLFFVQIGLWVLNCHVCWHFPPQISLTEHSSGWFRKLGPHSALKARLRHRVVLYDDVIHMLAPINCALRYKWKLAWKCVNRLYAHSFFTIVVAH